MLLPGGLNHADPGASRTVQFSIAYIYLLTGPGAYSSRGWRRHPANARLSEQPQRSPAGFTQLDADSLQLKRIDRIVTTHNAIDDTLPLKVGQDGI